MTSVKVNETFYGGWDRPSYWDGTKTNSFLVGMESYHHNGHEDRRYKYLYQSSENWILTDCSHVRTNENYEKKVEYKVHPDQVIAGNNSKEKFWGICPGYLGYFRPNFVQ